MSLMAKSNSDFELPPEGVHVARCFRVIDLGYFKSKFTRDDGSEKWQHKVRIEWELPTESMEDGQPFAVNNRYTLSLDDRSILHKHLVSWRGRAFTKEEMNGFDISKLLGVPCQIQIVHNEGYANIENVMALPSSMECPAQVNESFIYSLDEDPEGKTYDTLPEWMQKKIGEREEPVAEPVDNGAGATSADPRPEDADDVPF